MGRSTAGLQKKKVTVHGRKGTYQRSVMVRGAGAKPVARQGAQPSLARQSARHGFLAGLRQGAGMHTGMRLASRFGKTEHIGKAAMAGLALGTAAGMHNIHKDKKYNEQWRRSSEGTRGKAHAVGSLANIAGGIAGAALSHLGHTGYDRIKHGIRQRFSHTG